MRHPNPEPARCAWCDRRFSSQADLIAHEAEHRMDEAMGPRTNPRHPMFRYHNCSYCSSGERPCKQGDPHRCDWPRARND